MSASPGPSRSRIAVEISDTQGHLAVDPEALAALARRVLDGERPDEPASISLALVDDATIQVINARHLGHDWPTDVISFVHSEPGAPGFEGELVVSAERAVLMAGQLGVDPWAELALYVVHGLLHLCGYDDLEDSAAALMRLREQEVLAREGLTNKLLRSGLDEADGGERESGRWAD